MISFVLISIILGLYQSYIGCLAELLLFNLVYIICKQPKSDRKVLWRYVFTCLISAIGGALTYYIVLKIELFRHNATMSSYKGADSFSVKNILLNIPSSIKSTYLIMFRYINNEKCNWNVLPRLVLWALIAIIAGVFVIITYSISHSAVRTAICVAFLCFTPMATNITTILIPNNEPSTQQTAPLALVIPGIVALCYAVIDNNEINCIRIKKTAVIALTAVLVCIIHGSVLQTLMDQDAMRQGTQSAKSISQSVINRLIADGENLEENTYAFVGWPADNELVRINGIYEMSNGYARMAGPYPDGYMTLWTWRGILANVDGLTIKLCDDYTYLEILQDEEVRNMPNYPNEGCIMNHSSGVRVIKVSGW